MIIFSATKRINKWIAPRLLSWSLRVHESLSSSRYLPSFLSPNALSLLPLAQRIVSIEVQDDYRTLGREKDGKEASELDGFVDQAWNVFFEDRYQRKLKAERDEEAEREAQRLYDARERKRRARRKWGRVARPTNDEARAGDDDDDDRRGDPELLELGERRVRRLEEYVRPALLPDESYTTRDLFARHVRDENDSRSHPANNYDGFVRWMRGEYLVARYGPLVRRAVRRHPELRDDAAGLSTLEVGTEEAPLVLPSVDVIRRALGAEGWSRRKVRPLEEEDDDAPGDGDDDDDDASIKRLIHRNLRGQIAHSGPLNAYFEMRRREDSYELWTREYVFGLARYLLDRIAEMDDDRLPSEMPTETIVLDVGAGDGRLAYFLRRAMGEIERRERPPGTRDGPPERRRRLPRVIATDDGSWRAPAYDNGRIRVERLSAIEALDEYGPRPSSAGGEDGGGARREERTRLIVLCSWMPPGRDWTAHFRRPVDGDAEGGDDGGAAAVERLAEEYVLIGEHDDGTCGHNWLTWGNPDFRDGPPPGTEEGEPAAVVVPPHVADGYERVDLDELSSLQFSRFDCERSGESATVSFRRSRAAAADV